MNDLLNKVIKICEPTFPTGKAPIKLKDQDGLKYNLWKTNQQGESVSYSFFKTLESGGAGQMVEIGYVEEAKSFTNKENKLINFTERTIRTMKASHENMGAKPIYSHNSPQTGLKSPVSSQANDYKPTAPQENTYNQEIDKKAFGMCKYGFLMEAFKDFNITENCQEEKKQIEKRAEEWAEMSIRILPKEMPTGNEEWNKPLGNNGEEVIPNGQREDQAENENEDINVPF